MNIKFIIVFFLVLILFINCDDNCFLFNNKEDCLSFSDNCLFAKNSYKSYENSNCIFFNDENEMENFCTIFQNMNKKEKFSTDYCESNKKDFLSKKKL